MIAGPDAERRDAANGRERPYTLVYDGMCRICTPLADVVRRRDRFGEIDVVPSQAAGVMARFPWIPPRAFAEALQLIGPGGRTWHGAAAVEQLLAVLPRGPWISWIFQVPFVRGVAERLYRWVARHRSRLGCGTHCQGVNPPAASGRG